MQSDFLYELNNKGGMNAPLMIESLVAIAAPNNSCECPPTEQQRQEARLEAHAVAMRAALANPSALANIVLWVLTVTLCVLIITALVARWLWLIAQADEEQEEEQVQDGERRDRSAVRRATVSRRHRTLVPNRRLRAIEALHTHDGLHKCVVCMAHDVSCVCVPCGHLGLCVACSRQMVRGLHTYAKCPTCAMPVATIVRTYTQSVA